jgi:glyoxylase-like metal-dependent hydrolase (beta-lactamase superfamily II)
MAMQPVFQLRDSVTVVKVGTCTVDPGKIASSQFILLKNTMGIGGGSTVTIIRDETDVILIDTGFEKEMDTSPVNHNWNRERLKSSLLTYDIHPQQITKVFLSHIHYDHFGNIELFPQADWYCHSIELAEKTTIHPSRFIPVNDGDRISLNTIVKHTPGHTKGHSSLLFKGVPGIRIAVCGDAIINLAWLLGGYQWQFNQDFEDSEKVKNSIQYLLNNADIIIPGHGEPFFSSMMRRQFG